MNRLFFVYFLVLFTGISVIAKVAYTQIREKEDLKNRQKKITIEDIIVKPMRGDILASDGKVLATSVPSYAIRMDPCSDGLTNELFNENIDSLALCLARMPGRESAGSYKQKIVTARRQKKRYLMIDPGVDYIMLKKIKKYPLFRLGSNKGGLIIETEENRKQPHEGLAGRTIGYLTKDPFGNYPGLEGAYNTFLRGKEGVRIVQRLWGGARMPVNSDETVDPVDGGDVVSTIDVHIQDVAETSLRKCLTRHNAHHGSVIVMEVATGEVKAIVNLGKAGNGNYSERYNYALGEAVEPGSTFKLMSYMAAMEDGYIQLTDSVNNGTGVVSYLGKEVNDDHRKETMGWLTVEEAFAFSSNVSITKMINKYYKGKERQFINRLYAMNLNNKLDIELSGESEPFVKYPDNNLWSGISLTQIAYGYEVLLTPIHTLTFYNAVANNGKMVKPRFVKELRRHGSLEERKEVTVIKSSVASQATIHKAKQMMEAVVNYGTAKRIKTDLYRIAGKTGTAQIANEQSGYRNKQHYASFAGYFPADRPKYSCIVTVYAPSQNGTGGGVVAAPVFREIADKIYAADPDMNEVLKPEKHGMMADIPYSKSGFYGDLAYVWKTLEIPVGKDSPKTECVSVTAGEKEVEVKARGMNKNLVPNVVDMGLKDALFLLEQRGLRVSVRGRGRIITQSVAPGSEIARNHIIVLEMSQK
ncbi:MAG: transpeptidase family protein [Bacteroidales bacterium]|nr:transpeptidase family protein [Bacteroidales bacterium]